ncbi:MAG: DUF885 domain-containing protein [Kineosporiaceae bacterium]
MSSDERWHDLADRVLDAVLADVPDVATSLGDHRFDDRLPDLGPEGVEARAGRLHDALSALDQVDDTLLEPEDRVDLEMLRSTVASAHWQLTEFRGHESDPLVHLPSGALYSLIARPGADPVATLRALGSRLAAVPAHLARAREVLGVMPRVHVETAIGQARGTAALLDAPLTERLEAAPASAGDLAGELAEPRRAAAEALEEYASWLTDQLPHADADPRLGEQRYAARLWYALDSETTPDQVLTRAESDLQAVEEELAELASRLDGAPPRPGQVGDVLARFAASAPIDDATILPTCETALAEVTARTRALDLVTIPDDPVRIIVMPEAHRGVAVAYCDPPGPLEPLGPDGPEPTFFAVSPTPAGWSPERVASFYREYNGHQLRCLSVHEGVPGHLLQLAHAARFSRERIAAAGGRGGGARVRAAFWSGAFTEGWAVYTEELLARTGLGLGDDVDDGYRLHRLKMLLRTTINAILDVRVHAHGMTEAEAMHLMTVRGHQEEGEAAGKWRRALLTSAQLSTYYVGHQAVRDIVADLRRERAGASERELHDAVLAHGSPAPRHLRALLDLPAR